MAYIYSLTFLMAMTIICMGYEAKLLPEYGVLFEPQGEIRHNLEIYDMVLEIPFPNVEFLQARLIPEVNCTNQEHIDAVSAVSSICMYHVKVLDDINSQITQFNIDIGKEINQDLFDILPRIKGRTLDKRDKRGIGWDDVAIAFGGIFGAWGVKQKERKLRAAIEEVGKEVVQNRKGLMFLKEKFLMFAKHQVKAITDLHEYTDRLRDKLHIAIKHINLLHDTTNKIRNTMLKNIHKIKFTNSMLAFYAKAISSTVLDQLIIKESISKFLSGLDLLSTGYLSRHLVSPSEIQEYLTNVTAHVKLNNPNYEPVFTDVHKYYDIPNVHFGFIGSKLNIIIPVYLKRLGQQPMTLYKIRTTPVPAINTTAGEQLYTEIKPKYKYIAIGQTSFITLDRTELEKCQHFQGKYYCQNFLMIQTDKIRGCESTLYYDYPLSKIQEVCEVLIKKIHKPKPVVFDSGENILIAHVQEPWQIIYDNPDQLPEQIQSSNYGIVKRHQLCKKSLSMGQYFIPGTLASCQDKPVTLYYSTNSLFRTAIDKLYFDISTDIQDVLSEQPETVNVSIKIDDSKILGVDSDSEMKLEKMVEQLENYDAVYFSEASLQNMKQRYAMWKKPTSILTYVALAGGAICAITIGVMALKHKNLRNILLSFATTGGLPVAKAEGSNWTITVTYISLATVCTVLLIVSIGFIIYVIYEKYRKEVYLETTLYLKLKSQSKMALIKIMDLETIPLHIWQTGKFQIADVKLDKNFASDYLFINWRNLAVYDKRQKLILQNYATISTLKRRLVRRIFMQGVQELEMVMIFHKHLYPIKSLSEITEQYLNTVTVGPLPVNNESGIADEDPEDQVYDHLDPETN